MRAGQDIPITKAIYFARLRDAYLCDFSRYSEEKLQHRKLDA